MPTLSMTPTLPLLSLTDDDRARLYVCVHRGHTSARTRAHVALKLGDGWSEAKVCHAFGGGHLEHPCACRAL